MAIFGYDAQQPCKKKDELEILSLKTLLKNNAPADETHNRHAGNQQNKTGTKQNETHQGAGEGN